MDSDKLFGTQWIEHRDKIIELCKNEPRHEQIEMAINTYISRCILEYDDASTSRKRVRGMIRDMCNNEIIKYDYNEVNGFSITDLTEMDGIDIRDPDDSDQSKLYEFKNYDLNNIGSILD